MISPDLITRLTRAHHNAVKAAQKWSEAAKRRQKTDTLYSRYENAEQRFDSAVVAVVEAAKRRR